MSSKSYKKIAKWSSLSIKKKYGKKRNWGRSEGEILPMQQNVNQVYSTWE